MNVEEFKINTNIYCLDKSYDNLPEKIELIKKNSIDLVFPEIYQEMCELKSKIDEKDNSKLWDKAKRYVNPYEIVNVLGTNILKNETNKKYDNYTPLSRAFFKLTEIYLTIDIVPNKYKNISGVVANIAEGPGGFIEALYKQRQINNINDIYYGITLHSKSRNIPGWGQLQRRKKHFLNNKNVFLKTGNLYNINTIINYSKLFEKQKAWLVTCDGGFDYSNDFNNQEKNSRKIIYAEIITTLLIQENGGSLICKMFDLFTKFSLQIIYLLNILYDQVNIIKPLTSRPANSEKYIVATGFKGVQPELVKSMIDSLLRWEQINNDKNNYLKTSTYYPLINISTNVDNNVNDNINDNINNLHLLEDIIIENIILPNDFIKNIKKINISLTNNQKDYIIKTLKCIENFENFDLNKKYQKIYSEIWFNKYNIVDKNNLFNKQ